MYYIFNDQKEKRQEISWAANGIASVITTDLLGSMLISLIAL